MSGGLVANAQSPLAFAMEGERVRRAASILDKERAAMETSLRRAIPFLARRNVTITLSPARATPLAPVLSAIERPLHTLHLVVTPGGGRGALILDAAMIGLLLDGALGGDGSAIPRLDAEGLTAAQVALIQRLGAGMVSALSEVLGGRIGLSFQPAAPSGSSDEQPIEGAPITCTLDIVGEAHLGRVVLLLPKESLLTATNSAETPPQAAHHDPRIATVLDDVEVELVVELTRLRMRLHEIALLRVGDTLPLDIALGAPVTVRVDERRLLRGTPTSVGGRIAVKVHPTV